MEKRGDVTDCHICFLCCANFGFVDVFCSIFNCNKNVIAPLIVLTTFGSTEIKSPKINRLSVLSCMPIFGLCYILHFFPPMALVFDLGSNAYGTFPRALP